MIVAVRRVTWRAGGEIVKNIDAIVNQFYLSLLSKIVSYAPASLYGANMSIQLPAEDTLQMVFTGMAVSEAEEDSQDAEESEEDEPPSDDAKPKVESNFDKIFITPLPNLPNHKAKAHYGRLNLHLIKEHFAPKEEGTSVFIQRFFSEATSIARAHVKALGGNALCCFHIDQLEIFDNKDGANCILNISGDVFSVE